MVNKTEIEDKSSASNINVEDSVVLIAAVLRMLTSSSTSFITASFPSKGYTPEVTKDCVGKVNKVKLD